MKRMMIFLACLLAVLPAYAHHSDAGLDMDSVVRIEGTVTEFAWRNPHVYIEVEARDERGQPVSWEFQMGGVTLVARMGWSADSLQTGEQVTIEAHAALSGRPYGLLRTIEKESGERLPTVFDRGTAEPLLLVEETGARATSLEGRWMADVAKLKSYPGGYDGFYRAELTLTEKGREAQATLDELTMENPESQCLVRPTPGMIVTTNLFPIDIEFIDDIIMLRSEYFDDERTVYMDGRGHPDAAETNLDGHSIGHWEGDVLVVDTRNFAFHRSPYQMGVPSGNQKHVVERYQLINDGERLLVEFMLEDPEYLVGTLTHSRELVYSPQLPLNRWDCDPESSSRFVPE